MSRVSRGPIRVGAGIQATVGNICLPAVSNNAVLYRQTCFITQIRGEMLTSQISSDARPGIKFILDDWTQMFLEATGDRAVCSRARDCGRLLLYCNLEKGSSAQGLARSGSVESYLPRSSFRNGYYFLRSMLEALSHIANDEPFLRALIPIKPVYTKYIRLHNSSVAKSCRIDGQLVLLKFSGQGARPILIC